MLNPFAEAAVYQTEFFVYSKLHYKCLLFSDSSTDRHRGHSETAQLLRLPRRQHQIQCPR